MYPRGQVPITLDRERTLWMRYRAIALAEEQLGRPFPSLNLMNLGVREYGALLWACLSHEDDGLRLDDMYGFMDEYGLPYISAKLLEAMASAWPKDKDDGGKKEQGESTGTRSSSSPWESLKSRVRRSGT